MKVMDIINLVALIAGIFGSGLAVWRYSKKKQEYLVNRYSFEKRAHDKKKKQDAAKKVHAFT